MSIHCPGLAEDVIYMSGIFVLPVGENIFRVGATHEWDFTDENPSENARQFLEEKLNRLLTLPYSVVDHKAGIRPTVRDRRPLLGRHREHKNVYLFNGLGTKGVQLSPFMAHHFAEFLNGGRLDPEVDIRRFD